jgi:meso-butanediol dehydrogenase / (S,S)-butanediol dehydrogenase / diacetyl reductase
MERAASGDRIRIKRSIPGHRHSDLDDATSVHREQCGDRTERSGQNGVPVGRAGQAQDITNGLLLFTSDMSSYMTGAELVIEAA